jgi:S-DNA-T family DNA segregation ATPase FtsK/SpoIIIE
MPIALYIVGRTYKLKNSVQENIAFCVPVILWLVLIGLFEAAISEKPGLFWAAIKYSLAPNIGLAGFWIIWILSWIPVLVLLYSEPEGQFVVKIKDAIKKRQRKTPKEPTLDDIPVRVDTTHFAQNVPEEVAPAELEAADAAYSLNIKEMRIPELSTIIPATFAPQGRVEEAARVAADFMIKEPYDVKNIKKAPSKVESKVEQKPVEIKMQRNEDEAASIGFQSIKPVHNVSRVQELEENKKLLQDLEIGQTKVSNGWTLPPTGFFAKPQQKTNEANEQEIDQKIAELIDKLSRFKIEGDVIRTYTGPVVTTFEFKPAANIKVSRILTLQDDMAMTLRAQTIRIQAPIPGKDVVGIEIPNKEIHTIYMRELLESELFQKSASPLTLIMGKDIVGNPFVTDLRRLPHLLIAGTTGSGKSVGINAMILSLLYKNSPDDLRLVMIDPKMLEFSIYNDIPHLLTPVITKPKQAVVALANMVREMERRNAMMADTRTKNIENYNEKALREGYEKMPYIVVIIDELADLMMTSGKDVEFSIARLAQMARASGIHLIVATQRPSVDVVTGLIKANLPSRVSFKVGQKIDSKVILDQMGADSLLGRGDMLFTPPGMSGLVRLHAPWSSEGEIEKVVEFLKAQRMPEYDESFLDENAGENGSFTAGLPIGEELDELYNEAKNIVLSEKKTSISYLQRRLQIGYNRSARIVEQLELTGVLSKANQKNEREIL